MRRCHAGTKGSRHTVPQVLFGFSLNGDVFNLTEHVLRLIEEHASCFCYLRCDRNWNVLQVSLINTDPLHIFLSAFSPVEQTVVWLTQMYLINHIYNDYSVSQSDNKQQILLTYFGGLGNKISESINQKGELTLKKNTHTKKTPEMSAVSQDGDGSLPAIPFSALGKLLQTELRCWMQVRDSMDGKLLSPRQHQ